MYFKSLVVFVSGLVALSCAIVIENPTTATDGKRVDVYKLVDEPVDSNRREVPRVFDDAPPGQCTEKELKAMRSIRRYINWLHNRRVAATNGKYPSSDILPVPNVAEYIGNPETCQELQDLLKAYPIIQELE
ncbi:hypothetical protein C0993_000923 [Termitomyces sp. T159_Od127]|nr:hypothetical protein C0993_000923 [Termitomyces sp. T159_Od127]